MAAHWRAEQRRQQRSRWRRRLGLQLVHVGLRLTAPMTVADLLDDRVKASRADS
jgi:hypothetical protein